MIFFNLRSSGDTLSRENFYKLKQRLAETRMLAAGLARPEDTYVPSDDHGYGVSNSCRKSMYHFSVHKITKYIYMATTVINWRGAYIFSIAHQMAQGETDPLKNPIQVSIINQEENQTIKKK